MKNRIKPTPGKPDDEIKISLTPLVLLKIQEKAKKHGMTLQEAFDECLRIGWEEFKNRKN